MPDYDWDALNNDGNDLSFLRAAIENNRLGDPAYAVNMYNFDMNFFPDGPGTPLCMACKLGRLELAKELVDWGADIHVQPDNEYAPLILAAMNGHEDVVRWLLDNGVDPHHIHERPETADDDLPEKMNAFDAACRKKSWNLVQYLADAGVSMSSPSWDVFDHDPEIILAKVCEQGLFEIAQILVRAGIDPDARPDEYPSPLIQAVRSGNRELVAWLLQQGADPDYEFEQLNHWGDWEWGGTAFTAALESERLDLSMLLLDHGATPDVCGMQGTIDPIFLCIEKKWNILLAKMLAGHDLKDACFSADDISFTPLSFAIKAGNHDAALMLISQGLDVNKEVEHWSAVDVLIYESKSEFLPVLLDNGLNLLRPNNHDGNYIFVDLLETFPEHAGIVARHLAGQLNDRLGR